MGIQQTAIMQQNAAYSALVMRQNELLGGVFDLTTVDATWELIADEYGRPRFRLRLRDQTGTRCSADFVPEELQNDTQMTTRLEALKEGFLRIGRWRDELQQLFADIRRWCQKLPGGADIQEDSIGLNEVRSGEYEVNRLIISRNGETMWVEPVAAWVVGAEGEVDLIGTGGPLYLFHSNEGGSGWEYMPRGIPLKTIPLTEALFLELVEECLDG